MTTHFQELYVEGKFGRALRVQRNGVPEVKAQYRSEYQQAPLTLECWARLDSADTANVLVSNGARCAGTFWELRTFAESGALAFALQGYDPGFIMGSHTQVNSDAGVVDGAWHFLAVTWDGQEVALFVDGMEVVRQAMTERQNVTGLPVEGPLCFGSQMVENNSTLTCEGAIAEVRISNIIRPIVLPAGPLPSDEHTIGLWRPGEEEKESIPDHSPLRNHARVESRRRSLDEVDRESFHAGPAPLDSPLVEIALTSSSVTHQAGPKVMLLDGIWMMAEGSEAEPDWTAAIHAQVPGSVHAALRAAGLTPDHTWAKEMEIVRLNSFKHWWLKTTFPRPQGMSGEWLIFDGICSGCTVYLNGQRLGSHLGMFGGPEFNISTLLQDDNTLVVHIEPSPEDWKNNVVFNNTFGWHYSRIPPRGIWRSVRIEGAPAVRLGHPFVATRDALAGKVELQMLLTGPASGWSGRLLGTIAPDNFAGTACSFSYPVHADGHEQEVHLGFAVPEPRLWWPVDLGEPSLYRLSLTFLPDDGIPDHAAAARHSHVRVSAASARRTAAVSIQLAVRHQWPPDVYERQRLVHDGSVDGFSPRTVCPLYRAGEGSAYPDVARLGQRNAGNGRFLRPLRPRRHTRLPGMAYRVG